MVSYFFPVKILNLRKGEGNKLRLPKFMIRMDRLSLHKTVEKKKKLGLSLLPCLLSLQNSWPR